MAFTGRGTVGRGGEPGGEAASAAAEPTTPPAFVFWSFLWASAVLFSLTAHPPWFFFLAATFPSTSWFEEALLTTVALTALLAPGSPVRLSALAAAQLAHVAFYLPEVPNHRIILAVVNLAFFAAMTSAAREEGTWAPSSRAVWERFLPLARAIVILVYFFAFFAKLNVDFLDPSHSCAVQFYSHVTGWITSLPEDRLTHSFLIYATLAVEGSLPILLATRRWRTAGAILGLVFHFFLSLDLVQQLVNFSAVMSALLVLFLPREYFRWLSDRWRARGGTNHTTTMAAAASVGFLAIIGLGISATRDPSFAVPYYGMRQSLWFLYALFLIGSAVPFLRGGDDGEPGVARRLGPAALLVILVVVANGASPYLGLKTRSAFGMYSNLDMGAGESNHLIVPRSLDVAGFVADVVTIVESNDPRLKPGEQIPYFQFSAYLGTAEEDVAVRYVRDRKLLFASADTRVPVRPPWLLRKLLIFQPVGSSVTRQCVW